MRTADEIRNTEFVKSTFGGYRQADVEIFLEELADQMQKLQAENKELTRKCEVLQKRIEDFQGDETSLQSVLMSAQKLADSIVADAKATADKVIEKTGEQATEILSQANMDAENLKVKAEAEATRILGEAVQKSKVLLSGAEERTKKQIAIFDGYKIESSKFKKELIEMYKKQLELILSLPDEAPETVVEEEPAAVVEETVAVTEPVPEETSEETVEDEPIVIPVAEEDVITYDIPKDEEDGEEGFVIFDEDEDDEDEAPKGRLTFGDEE